MSIDEIINNAIFIQFPKNEKEYNAYYLENIHKLPIYDNIMYKNWYLNTNHFTTEYHRKYVLPLLNELLNMNYNESDFHLVKNFYNNNDISMLYPNNDFSFSIYSFEHNEKLFNITFNDLVNSCNINDARITPYHKLYKYPHECSLIINNTINNNRKLLISGDSQMIPDISIIACYFKSVLYLDNRTNKSFKSNIEQFNPTDILIQLNEAQISKYLVKNFN